MAVVRWASLLAVVVAGQGASVGATAAPGPGTPPAAAARAEANQMANPAVAGPSSWGTLKNGARYDERESRTPGSGSISLPVPGAEVQSASIPVTPGVTYTLSAYLRSSDWPVLAYALVGVYDAAGRWVENAHISSQGTTAPGPWQEMVVLYTAKPGDASIRLVVGRWNAKKSPVTTGGLWVDEFFAGVGRDFERPPSDKIPFAGARVRVDGLGNFEVLAGGVWRPFFPFCIYGPQERLPLYSRQGFNCTMENQLSLAILRAAGRAVSTFNPDGMRAMLEIEPFMMPGQPEYGDLRSLEARLTPILASAAAQNVLAYYWDNEQYDQYEVPRSVMGRIRQLDVDSRGRRLHPIYMNFGQPGAARVYRGIVDVVGGYAPDTAVSRASVQNEFAILQRLEGQDRPVGLAIVSNEATPAALRRTVYQALIAGARSIAYYRDKGSQPDMVSLPSWAEFPRLRREIDKLLPILRQPHWTAWRASSDQPESRLLLGTRDHASRGYVFLVNQTPDSISATITLSGLPYRASAVEDHLTGARVASVTGGGFPFRLAGGQTAVLRLVP